MLNDPTAVHQRLLPDGRLITVTAMTFGKFRLNVGPADAYWYDDGY